jgi:hypothetical protein
METVLNITATLSFIASFAWLYWMVCRIDSRVGQLLQLEKDKAEAAERIMKHIERQPDPDSPSVRILKGAREARL